MLQLQSREIQEANMPPEQFHRTRILHRCEIGGDEQNREGEKQDCLLEVGRPVLLNEPDWRG